MFKSLVIRQYIPAITSVRHYLYPRNFIEYLRNQPEPDHTQIENGLNVVTWQREVCHACIGIFADAGARYENEHENGCAHLFEHLVFKGTKKTPRTKMQEMINELGIKLHAITTRELVAYYAYCQPCHIAQVVSLLSECLFYNAMDLEDFRQEKNIIYQEIVEQDTNPKALVFDYLHATAFQGTGLGQSVVGTTSNVIKLDRATITQYMRRMLHPCRMCIAATGCVSHEQILGLACQYFSCTVPFPCTEQIYRFSGSEVRYRNDALPKAHIAVAVEGPPFNNMDTVVMELARTLIGGWDKSQLAGEDHAVSVARRASLGQFCDAYHAFNLKYQDTSLWGVEFISTSLQQEDMLFTIQDVLLEMCTMASEGELQRAKEQLKSKLLYTTSSSFGAAKDLANHMLFNCCHYPTVYDRLDLIDKISLDDFKKTVYEYIYNKCPAVATVGPTEGLPDYTRLRSGSYWIRL